VPFWVGPSSLAATLPGLAASLGVLALRPAQPAHAWAMPVLAGTMLRAMLTLMIALVVVTATAIDKPVFMLTVLGVLLACLAIEVGVVLRMINPRGAATQPASLEGARS
jgi:cytochrome bd-type quinol oxidase subunit 1